jgi:hypothetical protein
MCAMAQTPYQRKLWLALQDAHTNRRKAVEEVLKEMIGALENDRYDDLPALRAALPLSYGAMVGPPPRSRAADQ